jgi:hypothetical protein
MTDGSHLLWRWGRTRRIQAVASMHASSQLLRWQLRRRTLVISGKFRDRTVKQTIGAWGVRPMNGEGYSLRTKIKVAGIDEALRDVSQASFTCLPSRTAKGCV